MAESLRAELKARICTKVQRMEDVAHLSTVDLLIDSLEDARRRKRERRREEVEQRKRYTEEALAHFNNVTYKPGILSAFAAALKGNF